jgi:4-amino-4-deoxy-L-arabinose transferase-like glycosyltransferase
MRRYNPIVVLIVVYLLVQLVYVFFFHVPFTSDSANYVKFARMAIQEGTYYPNPSSIFNEWLVAPVYINYLVLLLSIKDNITIILVLNILLNLIQLALVFGITRKLYNSRAACVAALLYMLYLNNLGLVMLNLTEFMFGIFVLLAIWFYISESSTRNALLCGLFTGLSIGVRPTGWTLIIVFLVLYGIDLLLKKASHRKIALIFAGVTLYMVPMGLLSERNIHRFEYMSTTGPANLIMSSTPRAKGVFDAHFFKNDSVYKTKKTYPERDQYMMQQAKAYIQEHPVAWLSLIPRKIYSTFISDGWTLEFLLHNNQWNLNTYLKGDRQVKEAFHRQGTAFIAGFWILNIWQQLIYGFIMIFFLYQLVLLIRKKFRTDDLIINLFILTGTGLSILSSVGNPRYKYNFLILAIILISPVVVQLYDKFTTRKTRPSEPAALTP